ncbi:MAG TPA: hypothetical protein VF122_05040 [Caulobacteraceae bacterium]
MADAGFENRLLKMFDDPPAFGDADRFAATVETRLNRGWGVRQLTIGAFGVIGGVLGVWQMMRFGVLPQIETASERSTSLMTAGFDDIVRASSDLTALPVGGEVLWMAAALGAMALAFAITRAVEEF